MIDGDVHPKKNIQQIIYTHYTPYTHNKGQSTEEKPKTENRKNRTMAAKYIKRSTLIFIIVATIMLALLLATSNTYRKAKQAEGFKVKCNAYTCCTKSKGWFAKCNPCC